MKIIPAIDIIDGKCVRLSMGDYAQKKIYNENPLEVAKQFESAGLKYLHLVDLDGAKKGKVTNIKVLEMIALKTSLQIDFGGGVKTEEDVVRVFSAGAMQINVGSLAVKSPETVQDWLRKYGAEALILSADVKNGSVAINGWQNESGIDIISFLKTYIGFGVKYVVCTDVSKDGMLQGPGVELYDLILTEVEGIELIASGGVTSLDDVVKLKTQGVAGVIIGKAIYENTLSLAELSKL